MPHSDITLCLTIGNRPSELEQSLPSLLRHYAFEHIIAINDFGDAASSEVFKRICPHATLLHLDRQLGHHRAVDYMYAQVKTPYIFHTEDDWLFEQAPQLASARELLDTNPNISSVCFRSLSDFAAEQRLPELAQIQQAGENSYFRLDALHPEWHGYTFNPNLVRTATWKNINGFAQFKKERHISRHLRSLGFFIAYQNPGSCSHIGFHSVANPISPLQQGLKNIKQAIRKLLSIHR